MLTGENSVLKRATQAKETTGRAEIEERIKLVYNATLARNLTDGSGVLKKETLEEELENEFKDSERSVTESADKKQWIITVDGVSVTVVAGASGGGEDTTTLAIKLEMKHTDQAPTVGGNIGSLTSENVPIPTGFYYVGGTKNEGVIISDNANDANKGTSHEVAQTLQGNQFVWVPVDQNQKLNLEVKSPEEITGIKLIDPVEDEINLGISGSIGKHYTNANITPTINGEYKAEVTTASGTETKKLVVRSLYAKDGFNDYFSSEAGINAKMSNMGMSNKTQLFQSLGSYTGKTITNEEEFGYAYASMTNSQFSDGENYTNSVNTNGGFYIGRYEAGATTKRTSGNASTSVEDIVTANGVPVSKANTDSYTYITRSQAKGLAEKMYTGKSKLITGAGWDRALGWLIQTNNKTIQQVVVDSKDWGNYSDDTFSGTTGIAKTGVYNQANSKGIYDLAGNVWEWTVENSSIDPSYPCVSRGGYFYGAGSDFPSFNRGNVGESSYNVSIRFPRLTYIVALNPA